MHFLCFSHQLRVFSVTISIHSQIAIFISSRSTRTSKMCIVCKYGIIPEVLACYCIVMVYSGLKSYTALQIVLEVLMAFIQKLYLVIPSAGIASTTSKDNFERIILDHIIDQACTKVNMLCSMANGYILCHTIAPITNLAYIQGKVTITYYY